MIQQQTKRTVVILAVLACLVGAFIVSDSSFPTHAEENSVTGGTQASGGSSTKAGSGKAGSGAKMGSATRTVAADAFPRADVQFEQATFGGGCFWCTEAVYRELQGVSKVVSGYSGGKLKNPTYQDIGTGQTGHAEVIQIDFDPAQISFAELLEVFWKTHDPTTLNRQGADVGTQYRSVVFFHNDKQHEQAEQYKQKLNTAKAFFNPVVTEITEFSKFYPAEDYHQNYFALNGNQGYCRAVIAPKVEKFRKVFADKLKGAKQASSEKQGADKTDWLQVDWKAQLTPEQYQVTRQAGTETPFKNKYWSNKRVGIYQCVCCGLPLFNSETKYKSGSGWPSFYQPIDDKHLDQAKDYKLGIARDDICCSRCQAHLGHVFTDGPEPTGLRYCMNSTALKFIARSPESTLESESSKGQE